MRSTTLIRAGFTAAMVLLAAATAYAAWQHYMLSPWTRDARVRAEVVRIAPDVSGLITRVAVKDNQPVKKGDLLFVVDRDRYQLIADQAEADLAAAEAAAAAAGANTSAAAAGAQASEAEAAMRRLQAQRRDRLGDVISREARDDASAAAEAARANWRQAQAGRSAASASQRRALVAVRQARIALERAQLDLARTEVRAPSDGTITNLDLRAGDFADTGKPRMALVQRDDIWIYGYFEETKLPQVHVGDPVDIRLMAGGMHLRGHVDSVAVGIADGASPTSDSLLAQVEPTFNWIRLAQRVPVRVRIDASSIPSGAVLAAGMSATLVVQGNPQS
ncbi:MULTISPECIES: efflux RND transporter periplasmic adaptor subunit [Rhodanobacter]|uniref:efflux RND transporter periplasmic adaptor subunit n=1 Tax=Rhodanobacter TaxID=75309 RepID=UPI0004073EE6|nr:MULTISPECIES: HlyD family secretion protein [Rhodanobacter]TAN19214.1 MAG: HlyD family secretion protein [Rhodanobacter sp.]UJJ53898.1 HlyD family secretion protein [Rhodanobacter thiooxydans]